jgi:hypothetical protein
MPSHSSHSSRLFTFRAPRWGAPVLPSSCCCWRSATSWGLAPFSHRSASRIFIMQPAAVPHRWSPRMMTVGLVVGKSEPGRGLSLALSFKDVHHPCWGGGQAELDPRLRVGSGPLFPSVFGGEGCSPSVALSAAVCLAPRPERLWCCFWCRLLLLGRSVAARSPHGCRLRRAWASQVQVLPTPPVAPGGRTTRRTLQGRCSCSGTVPSLLLWRGRK